MAWVVRWLVGRRFSGSTLGAVNVAVGDSRVELCLHPRIIVAVTLEHIVQLIIIINLCTIIIITIIIRVCTEKHHCHCQTLCSWRIVGRQAGKQAADRGY